MERRNVSIRNTDIVRVLSSYSWHSHQAVTIISGTGYISEANLSPVGSNGSWRYMGYRRINRIVGHFEPSDPNGRNENGRIRVELVGVAPVVNFAIASRLIASTVHLELIVERRPPRDSPIVVGRRRIQSFQ